MTMVKQSGPFTGGHIIERGTPAYWVIPAPLGDGGQYVPVTVVSVEETPDGRILATYDNRGAGFRSRAEVGREIVARKATGMRAGRRVTLRPSIGVPDTAVRPS
jgi:hypothetical protein